MIYPYSCPDHHEFEIIKSVAHIDDPESCPRCGKVSTRYISRTHFYGASDWDKAEFNPGLGMITKNSKHRDREAKARGLIEVGNQSCDKFMDSQDRTLESETAAKSEKHLEPLVYGIKDQLRKNNG